MILEGSREVWERIIDSRSIPGLDWLGVPEDTGAAGKQGHRAII